jgi:hypothetical protein
MKEAFPDGYNRTTISLPVSSVIRQGFRTIFTEHSKLVSEFQRNVVFKTQLFVNYFIISNCVSETPKKIFEQNFWYQICHFTINDIKEGTSQAIYDSVDSFENAYTRFITQRSQAIHFGERPVGFAQSLSDACVTIKTTYRNFYVETFESRIIQFLKHCLMNAFPNMSPGSANSIAEDYCIYQITREKELDPASIPAEHREAVITFTSTNPDMINLQRLVPATPPD